MTLDGQTYALTAPETCIVGDLVQVIAISLDGLSTLTVTMAGRAGSITFVPNIGGGPALEAWGSGSGAPGFSITGSAAIWEGPLHEQQTGREETALIFVDCFGL